MAGAEDEERSWSRGGGGHGSINPQEEGLEEEQQ